ncbi:hypothetical protein EGW08_017428 [Elysia chlorotica]|uniref:C2H2-type domain-containing protein n=1 Tax=Elysia chlorotica TaxID=188477 RepID=A0A433SZR4_ELYCH|nr:hypothetical protein EGW08_017428 [Elysia chlorotica]
MGYTVQISTGARPCKEFFWKCNKRIAWANGRVLFYKKDSTAETSRHCHGQLTYIRSASNRHEQNLELCREGGILQVLTLRQIDKGETLLIWYGEELARELGVPFLTPAHIRGSNEYACTACASVFAHPNALKAHIFLQCSGSKSRLSPREDEHLLVPFEKLLLKLNNTSKVASRRKQEQSDNNKPHKAVNMKLKKPSTSKEGNASDCPDTWSSPASSSSLTLSLSSFSSPPLADDSITMSPDSSTDQNSALNLSLRVESTEPSQMINPLPKQYEPYHNALSIKRMEEMQRQHQHNVGNFQQNPSQFQNHLHKQSKKSFFSPSHCGPPSIVKNATVSSPIPPSPQSQHHQNQEQQPHQSPRTSSSNVYGLSLPSDKEPLDLLPQAYFANKSKKGHLCIYCGKVYSRKYGLKIHMRTHNGYKPLKCKICSRPFGDPSNLNKHVRLHAQGETPYRCDYCGKVLVRRRDLDRHIKSRHPCGRLRSEVSCDDDHIHNNAEEEEEEVDWEAQKDDDGCDDIIDVAGVDGESILSETALSE